LQKHTIFFFGGVEMNSDHKSYLNSLAMRLEQTIPDCISIERKKEGWFSKYSYIHSLQVDLAPFVYCLELHPIQGIVAKKIKVVKEIRIKTEEMSVGDWLKDMLQALEAFAQQNKQIRFAIDDFLLFQ
jgi:hypothetical protein